MKVGTVVRIKELNPDSGRTFMEEPKNVLGYVYESFFIGKRIGYSVISENGVDLGAFSSVEKQAYVVYVSSLDFIYNFRTLAKLHQDWEKGLFSPFLEEVHDLKKITRYGH